MGRRVGDLLPQASGTSHLGVDGSGDPLGGITYDFNSITPFGHIHQNSGVFHALRRNNWGASSGIIRFNADVPQFEVSLDGGISYLALSAGAGVDSVGVQGGADLTGNIDLFSPSGYVVLGDTAGASPITLDVDVAGLSGLWNFPANGFPAELARCYSEDFTGQTSVTVTHNIGTADVVVAVVDDSSPPEEITPDAVIRTSANVVTLQFNVAQTGRVTVIGCV